MSCFWLAVLTANPTFSDSLFHFQVLVTYSKWVSHNVLKFQAWHRQPLEQHYSDSQDRIRLHDWRRLGWSLKGYLRFLFFPLLNAVDIHEDHNSCAISVPWWSMNLRGAGFTAVINDLLSTVIESRWGNYPEQTALRKVELFLPAYSINLITRKRVAHHLLTAPSWPFTNRITQYTKSAEAVSLLGIEMLQMASSGGASCASWKSMLPSARSAAPDRPIAEFSALSSDSPCASRIGLLRTFKHLHML